MSDVDSSDWLSVHRQRARSILTKLDKHKVSLLIWASRFAPLGYRPITESYFILLLLVLYQVLHRAQSPTESSLAVCHRAFRLCRNQCSSFSP